MLEFWILYTLVTLLIAGIQALIINLILNSKLERCKAFCERILSEFDIIITKEA